MDAEKIASPYEFAAGQYLPEWSPLPVSTADGEKVLLVKGMSGYQRQLPEPYWAGRGEVERWIASEWVHPRARVKFRDAGIALRLPADVIGLDVDAYGDKPGAQTFAELQKHWGPLERTWISTARPAPSGGRLYRLRPEHVELARLMTSPKGTLADGSPYGGLDVLRYCHRYLTVWPTWHGGVEAMYRWYYPDGSRAENELPVPEDLPYLPEAWANGLAARSEGWADSGTYTELKGEPLHWLRERSDGELCEGMSRALALWVGQVEEGGRGRGCHSAACRGVLALVGNVAEGHRGGLRAVEALWQAYRDAMNARKTDRRPAAVVEDEFNRALVGAIEKLPRHKFRDGDVCEWNLP